MVNILICEDNSLERKKLEDTLMCIINKKNYEFKIALSTENPNEVIKKMVSLQECKNVYILDIDLNSDVDGIKLARYIRERDPFGYIIFVTGHYELSMLTFQYKLRALDYIIKCVNNDLEHKLKECLEVINIEYINSTKENNENILNIKSGINYFSLKTDEILFLETTEKHHKIRIHTVDKEIECYESLKDIKNRINDVDFVQCHKSYIVNKRYIKCIDKETQLIEMIDGSKCYIAKRNIREFIKNVEY